MRVLVCGGRDYGSVSRITEVLGQMAGEHPSLTLCCGYDPKYRHFQGADQIAFEWAERQRIPCKPFPAAWTKHGKAAGPIRNQQMLDEFRPERVVAFPGGRGTADMVARAHSCGIEVIEITGT